MSTRLRSVFSVDGGSLRFLHARRSLALLTALNPPSEGILEHAVDQLRDSQGSRPSTFTAPLITKTDSSVYTSLLFQLYDALPPWARTFYDTTLDPKRHIYNFQTVNILITMQVSYLSRRGSARSLRRERTLLWEASDSGAHVG